MVPPTTSETRSSCQAGTRTLHLRRDERGLDMPERSDDDPIERLRRAGQASSYADVDAVEYQRELRDERASDRTKRCVDESRPPGTRPRVSDVAEVVDRLDEQGGRSYRGRHRNRVPWNL